MLTLAAITILVPCFQINWSTPGQTGRHFANDILECIFLEENIWISIIISLNFVPKGPIDSKAALV